MTVDLRVYLVTDTAMCGARGVPDTVRAAIAGGVTIVQVRDHDATTRELVALTRAVQQAAEGTGVPVLVDDRVDVALVTGADGVHVGQGDLHPVDARRLLGRRALIGLSTHTREQVAEVTRLPARTVDYIGIGPFHATATKPGHPTPLGRDGVQRLVDAATVPNVVIGGVKEDHVAALRATGADEVAVVSAICASSDPRAAAAEFHARWEQS